MMDDYKAGQVVAQGDNCFLVMPARAGKEAQYSLNDVFPGDLALANLNDLAAEASRSLLDVLQKRLEMSILAAFKEGKDFVAAPIEFRHHPEYPQEARFSDPSSITAVFSGGPVEPGSIGSLLPGWRLWRFRDWAEGKIA